MGAKGLRLSNLYFVLYILAIVLLLPDKRESKGPADLRLIEALLSSEFELKASDGLLSARAIQTDDTSFFADINATSSIYFSAQVHAAEVSYAVRNVRGGTDQQLVGRVDDQAEVTPDISLTKVSGTELRLRWNPSPATTTDELLQVVVSVEAMPEIPSRLKNSQQAAEINNYIERGLRVRDSVTILLSYSVDRVSSARIVADGRITDTVYNSSVDTVLMQPEAPFAVTSYTPYLQVLDGQQWENTITFSKQLSTAYDIKLRSDSPNTSFSKVASNQIRVHGVAKGSGQAQVSVSITDAEGFKTAVNFTVSSSNVREPLLPDFMFPDIVYTMDPGFPNNVAGLSILTTCFINGEVVYNSSNGATFDLSVDEKDVGSEVLLKREVDGKAYGVVYSIPIRTYPRPEVISAQQSNGDYIVKTRSYGVFQQLPNRVTVSAPGVSIQELTGSIEFDSSTHAIIQTFILAGVEAGTQLQLVTARGQQGTHTIQ